MRNTARGRALGRTGTDLLAIMAEIRPSLTARMRALEARLQRTTRRERLLLGGLILSALTYAPIAAIEWRDAQRDRYVEALTERSSARLSRAASRRIAAMASDDAAIADMKTWGFEASNLAIAQVLLEQKLIEATEKAGLANVKITPDAEITVIGPNQWMGGEVQADLRWGPVFAFLDALNVWPEGFMVKQFRYEITPQPNFIISDPSQAALGRVTIAIAVPVVVANPQPEPDA